MRVCVCVRTCIIEGEIEQSAASVSQISLIHLAPMEPEKIQVMF